MAERSVEERPVSFKVLKTFNYDGLIIEIIVKGSEIFHGYCKTINDDVSAVESTMNHHQSYQPAFEETPAVICELCFNDIKSGDEVILESCQDIFCRVCLALAIIDNESDVMRCPSKLEHCDKEILDAEIRNILYADNYEIYMINKLDKKLDSLTMKDENEFQSIVAEFDTQSPNYIATPHDIYDPFADTSAHTDDDDCDVYMKRFMNLERLKNHETMERWAEPRPERSKDDFNFDCVMFNQTSDQAFFIKQERGASNATATAQSRNNNAGEDLGAAGMWAQPLQHPSFVGAMSPVVKREPPVSPSPPQQKQRIVARSVLITNNDEFVCSICEMFVIEEQGVVLRNCRHNFCRTCLMDAIEHNNTYQVLCPLSVAPCSVEITDEEVQELLSPEAYHKFIEKCANYQTKLEEETHRNTSTVPALLELENFDYVENRSLFHCAICRTDIEPGDGLILKNCLHEYCKTCLARIIEISDELEVPCPFVAENGAHCEGLLQDLELRSLISPSVYETHLGKSIARAEAVIKGSFHCQTSDCPGWAEAGEGATQFDCPVCSKTNCIKCKAIHEGKSCMDYYYEINEDERKVRDTGLTDAQVAAMIARKEAMLCPGCNALIQKTTGCNHMKCSRCSRDFQWLGLA